MRYGASRRWRWPLLGQPSSRCCGPHRGPATLHRELAGSRCNLLCVSDERFDEAAFEAQTVGRTDADRDLLVLDSPNSRRGTFRRLREAQAAAEKAKALLWTSAVQLQLLDYFYYTALTLAALYDDAPADHQAEWRELLLRIENNCANGPISIADLRRQAALVSAEIARLEGRDLEAMRLYEHAIQMARENGFVQYEALAHELTARFYAARGFEKIAGVYLKTHATVIVVGAPRARSGSRAIPAAVYAMIPLLCRPTATLARPTAVGR